MTENGNQGDYLMLALAAVPRTRENLVKELRAMAKAKGEYVQFSGTVLCVRAIWLAAADLLEGDDLSRK